MPRFLPAVVALLGIAATAPAGFRAGEAQIDVTPERFPVAVNCGFTEVAGTAARDPLHARAIVLDDGPTRLAVVVVDSCMMPREFLDRAKALVAAETGIPADRQLIAATHTHTAPAVMGCLGSDPDPAYVEFLQRQLVRVVRQAVANLVPAKAGWAVADAGAYTNNRQWVLRADKTRPDPFGDLTVRSNMHPGYQHPDFVGPSGPTDPWLSLLSLQAADGKPLAVLANFSMHYFGAAPVSADYFGRFCATLSERVAGKDGGFVAVMSQGTAGDLHWMDYSKPQKALTLNGYADALAGVAVAALAKVNHRPDMTLAMAETTLTLSRRVPDAARLAWARQRVAALGDKKPTTQPDIYAREAVFLHDQPRRELKLQAIRVGDVGIAAIPDEVFGLTGLKIKARSPLPATFTIELANGAEGYIPPPDQHPLGGYTTWPARTAGLEVRAEPKVTDAVLGLLERVSGKPRRADPDPAADPYAKLVLADKPVGYWRLGELDGTTATDLAGAHPGRYETGVVFGLDGPVTPQFRGQVAVNRAAHFAGGRVTVKLPRLGDRFAVELWAWSGLRDADRPVAAVGADAIVVPAAPFREWVHVLYSRDGDRVTVYRNGQKVHEATAPTRTVDPTLTIGGSADGARLFEGRLAEVAVYDRPLPAMVAQARVAAAKAGVEKP